MLRKLIMILFLIFIIFNLFPQDYINIDAAVKWSDEKIYFFMSGYYYEYSLFYMRAANDYPKKIDANSWPGITFKTIDAVLDYDDKAYFFKENLYIRFDKRIIKQIVAIQ